MDNQILMKEMVQKSRIALKEFESYTQEQVDACVKAICVAFKEHAEEFSKETIEETGLGKYEDKIIKNTGSPDAVWYALKGKKSVNIIGEDKENKLVFVAKPKGIISAVAPTTNPNITALFNAAYALKGRNVCIIAPHPRAKKTTLNTVNVMNDALKKLGAPRNLIQCFEEPSIELTQLLMKNSDVIVATGGAAMVQQAYSSGHPAFGVGPGNVQTIIDRGFNYKEAVAQIVEGRKFDNGLICAGNQSVIMPEEAEEEIIGYFKENHVFYVEDEKTIEKFRKVLFHDGVISRDVVGQSAPKIAKLAQVEVPEDTKMILIKGDREQIGAKDVLCGEKMCPVIISLTYDTFDNAVAIAKENLLYQGAGHSAVIHTNDVKKAEYCGIELPVSRMIVNQPGIFAANSALANGFNPTSTLGCGSWGNNSISENLTYEHLINISRIGWIKDADKIPSPKLIWED